MSAPSTLNDDVVTYEIHSTVGNSEAHIAELRGRCMDLVAPLIGDHIWQRDAFQLFVSACEGLGGDNAGVLRVCIVGVCDTGKAW